VKFENIPVILSKIYLKYIVERMPATKAGEENLVPQSHGSYFW